MNPYVHTGCFVLAWISGSYAAAIRFNGDTKGGHPFFYVAMAFAVMGMFLP